MRRRVQSGRRVLALTLSIALLIPTLVLRAPAESEPYRSVKTSSMKIALTFDDGPHPKQTRRILEILDRYGVHATFFMIGVNVVQYPDVARAVLAAGHEVGNHTYSHRHLTRLSERELEAELGACEDALEELCEYRPHLFRPPEGAVTPDVRTCSDAGDYHLILWSLDTRDWETRDAQAIVDCVLQRIRPGDIILMHDYVGVGGRTPEALEILLPRLLEQGYEPVTVSRLIGEG